MRALNRELLGKGIDAARLGSRKQWEDVTRLTGKRWVASLADACASSSSWAPNSA
ncbi:hypothetical protein PAERUG_P48_London_17_VIM_2_01_13_05290 [Pseudomonas aeruginosa]|nr:hypothetical protein PAERUG_P48_London_17_VIM_2_01_13_05290 [Pseudomonas aeruginosa]